MLFLFLTTDALAHAIAPMPAMAAFWQGALHPFADMLGALLLLAWILVQLSPAWVGRMQTAELVGAALLGLIAGVAIGETAKPNLLGAAGVVAICGAIILHRTLPRLAGLAGVFAFAAIAGSVNGATGALAQIIAFGAGLIVLHLAVTFWLVPARAFFLRSFHPLILRVAASWLVAASLLQLFLAR